MLLLLFAAACAIRLEPTRTAFVAPVRIGDSRPLRFLVDTGASLTVIDRAAARELNIEPDKRVTALTTTGEVNTEQATVSDLSTGNLTIARTTALVADLPVFRNHGHLDGILGMNVFAGRSLLFDVRKHCLELDSAKPNGVAVRAREVAGRVSIEVDGLTFVIDSGASFAVLKSSAAKALAAPSGVAEITTAAGARQLSVATIPLLRIGGVVFRDVTAAIASAPDDGEDGLLPITLFRAIFVSAARDVVVIEK